MRRKIMIPGLIVFVMLGFSIASLSVVYAQSGVNQHTPIVERLATKFNLNPDEVQTVFDEMHNEQMANRHAEFAERLNDFVLEGKITEEQKQLIIDKHDEMQDKILATRNLDDDSRRSAMKSIHEEFKNWVEEQNIDLPKLGKMKVMHGFGAKPMMEIN